MSASLFENLGERIRPLLADAFAIEGVTVARRGTSLRFSGKFIGDSSEAFRKIQTRLGSLGLMVLAQREHDRVVLFVVEGRSEPSPSRPAANLILLGLTVLTTMMVGAQYRPSCTSLIGAPISLDLLTDPARLLQGLPFSIGVMAILGTHELGHYFFARKHSIDVTLPYFIPAPIGLGTLGAFIKMKGPVDSRRSLFDVGIAGPLAGLIVALPVLVIGLLLSPVRGCGGSLVGHSILFNALSALVNGVHARGWTVVMHPLAYAGWVGLLMTAINLLPVGQLDGGHIAYAILGKSAGRLALLVFLTMGLLALVYPGWIIWALLVFAFGLRHPPPLDDVSPLDRPRQMLGIATLIFALLIIVPVPFQLRAV